MKCSHALPRLPQLSLPAAARPVSPDSRPAALRSVMHVLAWLVVALPAGSAQAGGLITRLPPDGSWSRFDLEITHLDRDGNVRLQKDGTFEIRSVGQVSRDGETLRRLEFEMHIPGENDHDFVETHSVLIPEDRLTGDDNPAEFIEAAWQHLISDGRGLPGPVRDVDHLRNMVLSWVLHGHLDPERKLATSSVRTPLGAFRCPGTSGSRIVELKSVRDHYRYVARHSTAAPFGVVRLQTDHRRQFSVDEWSDRTVRRIYTLSSKGTDARRAIPDAP